MIHFFFKGNSQVSSVYKFKCIHPSLYAWFAKVGAFHGKLSFRFANLTIFHAFLCMAIIFNRLHVDKDNRYM